MNNFKMLTCDENHRIPGEKLIIYIVFCTECADDNHLFLGDLLDDLIEWIWNRWHSS